MQRLLAKLALVTGGAGGIGSAMARMGEVDDVAWAAVCLASDEAKFVTGQVLSPNGGWTMNQ